MTADVADHVAHKTRLLSRPCGTCITKPAGERIQLDNERVTGFLRGALENESYVVCHSTLVTDAPAVCRGFADRYDTRALRMIRALWGFIEIDPPRTDKEGADGQ